MLGFQTIRAHLDALTIDFAPLEIGIFPGPVHGIVVRTKQAAGADHLRSFFTNGAFSHEREYMAELIFTQDTASEAWR